MCGEYALSIKCAASLAGSPPRVRGIHAGPVHLPADLGITPACAGNTLPAWPWSAGHQDHPRVCGEYLVDSYDVYIKAGSPPRVRGILSICPSRASLLGITPACAGNTPYISGPSNPNGDHPRVCGEYNLQQGGSIIAWGSPPRVRGIPSHHH